MILLAAIVVSAVALTFYVAPFLPILVALVTKASAPGWLKAVVLLFLSGVSAAVTPVIQNGGSLEINKAFAVAFGLSYILAIASYYGLSKPIGVAGADGIVATKTAGFGIG